MMIFAVIGLVAVVVIVVTGNAWFIFTSLAILATLCGLVVMVYRKHSASVGSADEIVESFLARSTVRSHASPRPIPHEDTMTDITPTSIVRSRRR